MGMWDSGRNGGGGGEREVKDKQEREDILE